MRHNESTQYKMLLLTALTLVIAMLTSGCGTSPQEKRGVSNIPINSQDAGDTRSFGGEL